jgi:hypothetical protein
MLIEAPQTSTLYVVWEIRARFSFDQEFIMTV